MSAFLLCDEESLLHGWTDVTKNQSEFAAPGNTGEKADDRNPFVHKTPLKNTAQSGQIAWHGGVSAVFTINCSGQEGTVDALAKVWLVVGPDFSLAIHQ